MSDKHSNTAHDPVETLLRQATPRPAPPIEDEQAVREAVAAEWQAVVRQRQSKSRWRGVALAASVLIAIAAAFSTLRTPTVDRVPVATVDKHIGHVYRHAADADTAELVDAATIYSEQTVETAQDGALGVRWDDGGSLRLDGGTRVRFVNPTTIHLERGRVYFASTDGNQEARLTITTEHGSVTHLGTQYMTAVDGDALIVSVREGAVRIDGRYHEDTVEGEKQLRLQGSASPVIVDLPGHGSAWTWVESVAPDAGQVGQTVLDLLRRISRETGYELVFDSAAAERLATATRLSSVIGAEPRTELRLQLSTTDLDYAFNDTSGTLNVRLTN